MGGTVLPVEDAPHSRCLLACLERLLAPIIVANSELFSEAPSEGTPLDLSGALVMADRAGRFRGSIHAALVVQLPVNRAQAEAWAQSVDDKGKAEHDVASATREGGGGATLASRKDNTTLSRALLGEAAPLPGDAQQRRIGGQTLPYLQDRWPTLESIIMAGADIRDMLDAKYGLVDALGAFPDCCLGRLIEMGLDKDVILSYRESMPLDVLVHRYGLTPRIFIDELGLRVRDLHNDGIDLNVLVGMGFTGGDLFRADLLTHWAAWEALYRPPELTQRLAWTPVQLAVLRCWRTWRQGKDTSSHAYAHARARANADPTTTTPMTMLPEDIRLIWKGTTMEEIVDLHPPLDFVARLIAEYDLLMRIECATHAAAPTTKGIIMPILGQRPGGHYRHHVTSTSYVQQRVPHGQR